ncbi:MAG: Dabb family protein [Chitinophagaceae bacterium]|nr:Dabb family protein [Chitinophagaceae bacterium]
MKSIPRRKFIGQAALAAGAGVLASSFKTNLTMADKTFIHHVYFWLKNPGSVEDTDKLIAGLKKLSKVSTIASAHIGKPADTNREVIDRSYAVSWCLFFKNSTDQASYQTDPVHLKFIDECSSLWSKVVVYDSIDV